MKISKFLSSTEKIIHAYNRLCEPLLEKFDLPQVSFDILMFLANNPEYSTAQQISEIRHIKKNLISVHVEKLVTAGYLERRAVTGDRRKISLCCTDAAKPITDAGEIMQKEFFDMLTFGIKPEQWKIFNEIHETIETNAEAIAKTGGKKQNA